MNLRTPLTSCNHLGSAMKLSEFCGFPRNVLRSPRVLVNMLASSSRSLLTDGLCRHVIPPTSSRGPLSWPEAGGVHRFYIDAPIRRYHS